MTKQTKLSAELESDELLALARVDIEKGELEQALRKLKIVASSSEPDPEAIAMTARLYAQLGLLDRAKMLFEQYLVLHPDALNERFQLGMVHFDNHQPSEAANLWGQVLASFPTHPPALHYMGLLSAQQNRIPDARRHLEVLLETAPSDNLYFQRSKDLLKAIDDNANLGMPMERGANTGMPYPNEH